MIYSINEFGAIEFDRVYAKLTREKLNSAVVEFQRTGKGFDIILYSCAGLVVLHARRLAYLMGQQVYMPDLTAAGIIGLLKAAQTYDQSKSFFSTWAVWHIRVFVQRETDKWRTDGLSSQSAHTKLKQAKRVAIAGKNGMLGDFVSLDQTTGIKDGKGFERHELFARADTAIAEAEAAVDFSVLCDKAGLTKDEREMLLSLCNMTDVEYIRRKGLTLTRQAVNIRKKKLIGRLREAAGVVL